MRETLRSLLGQKLPAPLEGPLERLLALEQFQLLYDEATRMSRAFSLAERFLRLLNVSPKVSPQELTLIPKQGPVVAVANHPFGLLEGAILGAVLPLVRPDMKIMANYMLGTVPEAREYCIFVDPFGGDRAIRRNRKGLKDSISWLRSGGLLATFPAGEVAHIDFKALTVTDPEWSHNIARLIRITGATVLPIYFRGANSLLFQILGLLHPRARTAMLTHELLNKHNRSIELRIGAPIGPAKLRTYQDDVALIRYLRHRTYLLQSKEATRQPRSRTLVALSHSTPNQVLASEVSKLPPESTLANTKDFLVLLAKAADLPNVLQEIGRLRELTFRGCGEGTGRPVDLDHFDGTYYHLFLWHRSNHEVVGAYRLGPSDEILAQCGAKGFYTNQLFDWKRSFLDRISPAIELGRSFIRPEYQKSFAPLLLLWKGIGQYLVRNPQYKILFGPVSISNEYTSTSRQLMVKFLSAYRQSRNLTPLVRARNPFRCRPYKLLDELIGETASDVEDLSALVADLEGDRKGIPVLLKQYLKLGGELVSFHLDRDFSDCIDGLIVVDLRKTDTRVLEQYMGKVEAQQYLNAKIG